MRVDAGPPTPRTMYTNIHPNLHVYIYVCMNIDTYMYIHLNKNNQLPCIGGCINVDAGPPTPRTGPARPIGAPPIKKIQVIDYIFTCIFVFVYIYVCVYIFRCILKEVPLDP
jgi:hypothetical protein